MFLCSESKATRAINDSEMDGCMNIIKQHPKLHVMDNGTMRTDCHA